MIQIPFSASAVSAFVAAILILAVPAKANPFGIPYNYLTVDQLNSNMAAAAEVPPEAPESLRDDLGSPPKVGGFCPKMLDVFWKFPSALVEQCISPSVGETLKKCDVATGGKIGPGVMSGAADCLAKLTEQLDFSKPIDRITGALQGSIACMAKSVVKSTSLSEPEQRTAMGVIDGVKATYDEYQKLAKLAANLATGGPGVIPEFLEIDASGNDGDKSSISIGDWLIEADKIAADPEGYAKSVSTDKVKTSITAAIVNAGMNPTQAIEDLQNWWDPDRPLGGTDEMLRQCRLSDAQIVWANRRASMKAAVADERISMEHYRRLTYCQITQGDLRFDSVGRDRREFELTGLDRFKKFGGNAPTKGHNYRSWLQHQRNYERELIAYAAFLKREAEFQQKYRERAAQLEPLLKDAEALKALARANIRRCAPFVVPNALVSPLSDSPVEEMSHRIRDLKATLLGMGCSIPMANSYIAGIQAEVDNPYQKWSDFLSWAQYKLRSGQACSASGAKALIERFDTAVSESFGSYLNMQHCLTSEREKQIVADVENFSIAQKQLDRMIGKLGEEVAACDKTKAIDTLWKAHELLADLPCNSLPGVRNRNDLLLALSQQLSKPDCGQSPKPQGTGAGTVVPRECPVGVYNPYGCN